MPTPAAMVNLPLRGRGRTTATLAILAEWRTDRTRLGRRI